MKANILQLNRYYMSSTFGGVIKVIGIERDRYVVRAQSEKVTFILKIFAAYANVTPLSKVLGKLLVGA